MISTISRYPSSLALVYSTMLTAFACVASAAWASDAPITLGGNAGPAPRAAADVSVNPSLGTGSTDVDELLSRGVAMVPPTSFPQDGLSTVAYGAVGKRGKSIINWDSRTRAYTINYPNRAIVFITRNNAHHCTGWMYSRRDVVTAGHCVHTGGSSGNWYPVSSLRVYPGRDGAASPYGSCTVVRTSSVVGWTQNKNFRFDYGHMRLNCNVGNTVGWFGLYAHSSPTNQPAIIGGYPGDKPRNQWTSADKIRQFSNEMLAYRMDTVGGHSGSPIWHDRTEATATNGAWGFGVHNYGVGAFGSNTNAAARLTSTRITNYVNWRNAP